MYGFEYFNLIQNQILLKKINDVRYHHESPSRIFIPYSPPEPELKIYIPIKQINEDYNIKKFIKIKNKHNQKKKGNNDKIKADKPFFGGKNNIFISNNKANEINIGKNINKDEVLNIKYIMSQNEENCINKKKHKNIIIKNRKNNYFFNSLEVDKVGSRKNKLNIYQNIRQINSMKNIRTKLNIKPKNN